uniref:Endonuclease/exonuclease/phosphatase domain-containing protein n=1 Tax=viral metagenome TaxID=1070528 RepID=A0A6C0HHS5_9ZZZZ
MKILTWNILASEWIKKSYYPTVDKKILFDRKSRLKKIMERIMDEDPDILLLQEVMEMEYKTLYKHFQSKYHISILSPINWAKTNVETVSSESGNVTLLKKTVFKTKTEIYEQPLDQNFGLYSLATFTYKNKKQSKQIHIFNIHLNDLHGQTRNKQMNIIRAFAEKQTQKYCIIAGDFNQEFRATSRVYSLNGFTVHNKCATYYIEKNMNIDNILTKGFVEEETTKISNNTTHGKCNYVPLKVENGFKIYGSDHLPVSVYINPVVKE